MGNFKKVLKKTSNLILLPDEENMNGFLSYFDMLMQLMESDQNLIDLVQWLHISNKLFDHLKALKTKSNQITVRLNFSYE